MKLLLAGSMLLVSLAMAAAQTTPSDSLERTFAAGGKVRMSLSAGDYTIRAGLSEDKIRVRWSTKNPEQMSQVRVTAEVRGSEAKLETDGPKNDFHVEIELPRRTDLYVRLSAGDLKIGEILGDKDVESRAGDLRIEVGRPEDYAHVDASVTVGDLDARPFGASKGGLFRSFKWNGTGRHRLHAHLGAGDLRLVGVEK